jgi:hypothetical protein
MGGTLASHPYGFTVPVQQNGYQHKHAGKKCKQRAGPANAKVDIHGKEWNTAPNIKKKSFPARTLLATCVRKVIQDSILPQGKQTISL